MTKFLWLPLATLLGACAITPQAHTVRHEVVTKEVVEQEVQGMFRGSWTDKEKLAWGASATAHIADLVTSLNSPNCVETNPLLGDNPSNGSLIAVKAGAIAFEYWLQSQDYEHSWVFSAASTVIHGYFAATNMQNDCYGQR